MLLIFRRRFESIFNFSNNKIKFGFFKLSIMISATVLSRGWLGRLGQGSVAVMGAIGGGGAKAGGGVCVCVCERERERGEGRQRKREGGES